MIEYAYLEVINGIEFVSVVTIEDYSNNPNGSEKTQIQFSYLIPDVDDQDLSSYISGGSEDTAYTPAEADAEIERVKNDPRFVILESEDMTTTDLYSLLRKNNKTINRK